jgi:hypothetical protein
MDVKQLAPALHAIGEVLEAANKVLNGTQANISIRVKGSFKSGCFGIDFAITQGLWGELVGFLSRPDIVAAGLLLSAVGLSGKDAAKSLIGVIKWLKNRKITKVVEIEGNKVKIFVEGEYIEVEERVLKLLEDYSVRKALSSVIHDPLENEGIDKFAAGTEIDGLIVVEKSEAVYFASPSVQDKLIHETIYETVLQVISISFNEDNKWRLSDGTAPFYAEIADAEFVSRVQKNEEAFAKDDLLTVNIRKKQWLSEKGAMKTDFIVEKVIEHKSAAVQLKLDLY